MAPLIPVHAGILVGFPCPHCERWAAPARSDCGCYVCRLCGHHTPQFLFGQACAQLRAHMPHELRFP